MRAALPRLCLAVLALLPAACGSDESYPRLLPLSELNAPPAIPAHAADAAADPEAARADGEEIVDVRWFTRAELTAAFAGEADFALPGTASIAHRLIADWVAMPE